MTLAVKDLSDKVPRLFRSWGAELGGLGNQWANSGLEGRDDKERDEQ